MGKKHSEPRVYEYRILYNAGANKSALNNYHYFMAHSAEEALQFHYAMLVKKSLKAQTFSIEKKNPFNNKWEDKSDIIDSIPSPS